MVIEVTFDVTDVYISTTVSPVYVNVSFEAPSGGGGTWGSITGTLSDQTDLQTALDGKFDDPTGDTTQYIAGDGSLVAFPITGQAGTLVREVRNVTGATLTKGTVVYINGASGNKPTVAKAIATSDATSAQTFGLIQADIPNNSNGYLVAFGDLDGLNTSAFAEGVQLYLSATTAGGYTSTKQYAPSHLVYIGVVTRQHVNQGRIEVRIQNGYEMDELHDVAAQTPSNNDGLFYNSTNSLWENKSIATALGYTPANAATTLTINGVTFDLSANRTFTVGSVTGSGASGQVAYWTGTSAQSGSNNLFWDSTNSRLGIGTNTPTAKFQVNNSVVGDSLAINGASNTSLVFNTDSAGRAIISVRGNTSASLQAGGYFNAYGYEEAWFLVAANQASAGNKNWRFGNLGASNYFAIQKLNDALNDISSTPFVIHSSSSNVSIGSTFTADSGQRLQVQGTTLLKGNVTFSSATGMFWDATNSRLGIGTNAPSTLVDVRTNTNLTNGIFVTNSSTGSSARTIIRLTNDSSNIGQLSIWGSGTGLANKTFFEGSKDFVIGTDCNTASGGTSKFQVYVNGYNFATNPQFTLHSTGNLALGSTTDSGERLQVTGTMRVTGNVSAGANLLFNTTLPSRHTSSTYPAIFVGNSNSSVTGETTTGYKGINLLANIVRDTSLFWVCQDTTQPGWLMGLNYDTGFTDEFSLSRTPATAGTISPVKLFSVKGNGYVSIGLGATAATALTDIGASTTTRASLRIRSGTAPTSPNDGDIWFDGTDIKMRIGGVTKTFTLI